LAGKRFGSNEDTIETINNYLKALEETSGRESGTWRNAFNFEMIML